MLYRVDRNHSNSIGVSALSGPPFLLYIVILVFYTAMKVRRPEVEKKAVSVLLFRRGTLPYVSRPLDLRVSLRDRESLHELKHRFR